MQQPTKPDQLSAGWQLARLEGERDRANRATRSMENARDQAKRAEAEVDSLRARNERLCDKAEGRHFKTPTPQIQNLRGT